MGCEINVNDELVTIFKNATLAYVKLLSWCLLEPLFTRRISVSEEISFTNTFSNNTPEELSLFEDAIFAG